MVFEEVLQRKLVIFTIFYMNLEILTSYEYFVKYFYFLKYFFFFVEIGKFFKVVKYNLFNICLI